MNNNGKIQARTHLNKENVYLLKQINDNQVYICLLLDVLLYRGKQPV